MAKSFADKRGNLQFKHMFYLRGSHNIGSKCVEHAPSLTISVSLAQFLNLLTDNQKVTGSTLPGAQESLFLSVWATIIHKF